VVAHYINHDWQLEKRVLGLVLIDVSHSGQNIAERAISVLADYGFTDKVFAVTLIMHHLMFLPCVHLGMCCLNILVLKYSLIMIEMKLIIQLVLCSSISAVHVIS
jgi:hypothetical protein